MTAWHYTATLGCFSVVTTLLYRFDLSTLTSLGKELEGHTTLGFPMSSLLRSVGAHIGRNGRMLACQTINKFSETTSGASLNRIHWRAILQVGNNAQWLPYSN